jgi:hypothetical protein
MFKGQNNKRLCVKIIKPYIPVLSRVRVATEDWINICTRQRLHDLLNRLTQERIRMKYWKQDPFATFQHVVETRRKIFKLE